MNKDSWYQVKFIRKKRKIRKIVTYQEDSIKLRHLRIKEFLEERVFTSKFTKAYKKKSSIFKNAKAHMYNDIFIKLDIQDFFNSVNHKILLDTLYFELNESTENPQFSKLELTKMIHLCSIDKKGIPLGLITSPTLANIYLKGFDNLLYGILKKRNLTNLIYTRYADDLTISFKYNNQIQEEVVEIIKVVSDLLKKYKLKLNLKKTKVIDLNVSNHVRITGVSIVKEDFNYRRVSVGRKKINDLYHDTMRLYKKLLEQGMVPTIDDSIEKNRIRGMESFIYSIEKKGYENVYSSQMLEHIKSEGFESLTDLIKRLP
ncbi:reverse transcriptase domain-containing protein [Paenibacillus sp. TAB 01]|uniref:reverse transcriptase domain-containing protein n=1 Tax=Paenibacillus sp. TAB 01 TaxID=3368988 RepID=UPI003750E73D